MIPKIGPSTIAILTAAVVVMVAFIDTFIEGNPSVTLAAISAGLTALLGVLRSWQSIEQGEQSSNSQSPSGDS